MSQKFPSDFCASVVVLDTNSIFKASKKLSVMQKLHRIQPHLDGLEGIRNPLSVSNGCGVLGERVKEATALPAHPSSPPLSGPTLLRQFLSGS